MKSHVACDGPEMRAVYSLAAERNVPVLIHFADFPQFEAREPGTAASHAFRPS